MVSHRKHWRTGNCNIYTPLPDANDQYWERWFHVEIIQPGSSHQIRVGSDALGVSISASHASIPDDSATPKSSRCTSSVPRCDENGHFPSLRRSCNVIHCTNNQATTKKKPPGNHTALSEHLRLILGMMPVTQISYSRIDWRSTGHDSTAGGRSPARPASCLHWPSLSVAQRWLIDTSDVASSFK
jgi:hypothetical protein